VKRILNESGHERNRNAGDEAYFATMVDLFRECFGDIHITSFSDRPERDRNRYAVDTVYSGGTILKTIASSIEIVRAIKNCDVYVWGSGQILRDDTGIKSPLYRLSRPLLAKIMRKPVMAYAVGIGPIETRSARFFARHLLNTFDLITVRETFSKELIERIGVSKPDIRLTVDPAFALKAASSQQVNQALKEMGIEENTLLVGVAPFGPAYRGVRSFISARYQVKLDIWQPNGKENYHKHIRIMAEACDYIVERYKMKLIFFAQDISLQGLDYKIAKDIISFMKNKNSTVAIKSDDFPPSLIKGIMGKLEFVMGGRMHSLILASGIGTPVLGVCFEQKIKSFGSIIGQQEYFIDEKEIVELKVLSSIIDRLWLNRQKIKKELDSKMKQLRKMIRSNVLLLGKMLKISDKSSKSSDSQKIAR
jgi:polysaccharide pyruvyl transferase WcaK-like protein